MENRWLVSRNGMGKGLTTRGMEKAVRGLLEFGCDCMPPCILRNLYACVLIHSGVTDSL